MKACILTNEYPPNIYGGAGVHVEYLCRELAREMFVDVRCFGDQYQPEPPLSVKGLSLDSTDFACAEPLKSVFGAFARNVAANAAGMDADVVHCHTWYTHLGGILAKLTSNIPLVVTVHSLEPLRPWKREQLAGGYDCSLWVERTALEMADAVIAVSEGTRKDVLEHFRVDPSKVHVIYNGIDPEEYHPVSETDALEREGIDPRRPYVLFVGRITRQKGIIHLVRAIEQIDPAVQVVLCAGAPDTPAIGTEMEQAVAEVSRRRGGVYWVRTMLDARSKIQFYSHATLFCCPSIYEPFGIINLEALSCATPVVASHVGGIPEVVVHGETGLLVRLDQQTTAPFEPVDPAAFSRDLAHSLNELLADPPRAKAMGEAGRERVLQRFSWRAIADQTRALYQTLLPA